MIRAALGSIFVAASMTVVGWNPESSGRQQPRDGARAETGTASIAGRVLIDGDARRPARRARVTITDSSRTVAQTTTTDDRGAFAFRSLPAGQFTIQAFKDAYLRASYGAARPDRSGTPIALKDAQSIMDLVVPIVRGGVITGTARDVRDLPVPGVEVRVLRLGYNGLTGDRTLSVPGGARVTPTDDRGEYRAYGLPPGAYLVLVPGPGSTGRENVPIRKLTAPEVQQALQAARSGGSIGAASVAPPPAVRGRFDHAPVFHPGTADISSASIVQLGLGEERAGVDITIELVTTATVTVNVASPSGSLPATLSVTLVPSGPNTELLAGAGLRGLRTQAQAPGQYVFSGVPPGTYSAKAILGRGRGAAPDGPVQWATADVTVGGEDLTVDLTLQPGVPINGRVSFEGAQPTPAELESLAFMLVPPGAGGQVQSFGGGRVDNAGRFSFASIVPDTYRLLVTWNAASARERWSITGATANGREGFEAPFRVLPNEPTELAVTMTDTPATLTGRFVDTAGRPAPDYYILVFSADRSHWVPGSRRVRTTRPATDGTFTIKGLLPGDYYLAALPDLESGEWNDTSLLEQLVNASAKVTLREGQTTTQDYRMPGFPSP